MHRDTVDDISRFGCGARVVRNDDELGSRLELLQHRHIAPDIRVVERRVNLVEKAERAGLGEEDAEQQREGDERPLSAGQQVDALRALAARRRVDLDVAVERKVGVCQPQFALAAAEEREKDVAEILLYFHERREEQFARRNIDFADRLLQCTLGLGKIRALPLQEVEALLLLGVFLNRERIDQAKCVDLRAHIVRFGAQRIAHELREKGLSDAAIAGAQLQLQASELDAARVVWMKKFGVAPANARDKARQMRFLQGRGFSLDIIRRVLRDIED